ncbi:hypothetical protein [Roseovarius sp. EL26]|uniref:hypothetical protein n=1 Tax=Roseovarius sp. EL26 TaxID=2126672 RepID=UPI0020B12FDE|nr:hypothetical protein [Roseovarius sp. EL26]
MTTQLSAAEGFRLAVPEIMIETGFLKHLLPRFSLKTGVRIEVVKEGAAAEVRLLQQGGGRTIFIGSSGPWLLQIETPDHAGAARFSDWLMSEVGQRTITAFKIDGTVLFHLPGPAQIEVAEVHFDGDVSEGAKLSVLHCGRCHTVNEATKFSAIGSTPSFAVLRTMEDWDLRFQSFYLLNPHPAFTQIAAVTDPFPIDRPPPIIPVELTIAEFEAILAYVSVIPPADLGAPLQHQ